MNSEEQDWETEFALAGAYWRHDGNPKRPYALLTSGMISDGFFNGGRVVEDGVLFGRACVALWNRAEAEGQSNLRLRIVGAAYGAISLAARIAEAAKCRSAFAEPVGEDFAFLRTEIDSRECVLLTEDTITTGKTLERLLAGAKENQPGCSIANVVLTLCNRSGSSLFRGIPILSLISPTFTTWNPGQNPFSPDGSERVQPVRPKRNWHDLTRVY